VYCVPARDIQRRIQEAKERREDEERQKAQAACKRPRTDSLEADASHQTQSGEWIGGYFVEDYEEKQEDGARPLPLPSTMRQTGPRVTGNRRQDKRARLASLHAHPAQRVTTTPSPPPPPIPLSTTIQLLPPGTQNTPFVSVQVSNLPIEASLQSILFFFQHGADVFKVLHHFPIDL
jgi:hypothetical protein